MMSEIGDHRGGRLGSSVLDERTSVAQEFLRLFDSALSIIHRVAHRAHILSS